MSKVVCLGVCPHTARWRNRTVCAVCAVCAVPIRQTCTRWQELGETILFHARMAAYLGAPTEFRLLNPPCTLGGDSLQVCFCESVRVMSTGAGTARRFRNSERDADWRRQTR